MKWRRSRPPPVWNTGTELTEGRFAPSTDRVWVNSENRPISERACALSDAHLGRWANSNKTLDMAGVVRCTFTTDCCDAT